MFLHPFRALRLRFAPFSLSSLRPAHKFTSPKNQLLEPKNLLFRHIFAQKSLVFHCYLMHKATMRCAKLCNTTCIFQHFISHLAPFYLAFCSSLPCVLQQNARLNAAKHPSFSNKTPIVRFILHFHATELQLSCTYNPPHLL